MNNPFENSSRAEFKDDNSSDLPKFSEMKQTEFLRYFTNLIKGYTEQEEDNFTPADYQKFSATAADRLKHAKAILVSLAPILSSDIENISGVHGGTRSTLKEVHEEFLIQQAKSGSIIPPEVLTAYPRAKKIAEEVGFVEQNKNKVNGKIVEILQANFSKLSTQYFSNLKQLNEELTNLFEAEQVKAQINIHSNYFVEITDVESGLSYIMPFENNRPVHADVADYFTLKDSNGREGHGRFNSPIDHVERPAVIGTFHDEREGDRQSVVVKGLVQVKK